MRVRATDDCRVQTFLPYSSFERSAKTLDRGRLGKQRVESLQVLRALTVPGYGWRHHPAVRMWRGYDEALAAYGVTMCREWLRQGHADTCLGKIVADLGYEPRMQRELRAAGALPPWVGRRDVHRSHQSALLRKDPAHYGAFFSGVPDDLDYVWPGGPPAAQLA